MRQMPDKAFDLAIVDPPYGIYQNAHRPSSTSKLAKTQAYNNAVYKQDIPSEHYFNELRRVSFNQIIWGGNYFLDYLGATRSMVVWDKKTKETNWADAEIAWTSFDDIVRIFTFGWNGMLQEDMANKERRIHPTQKPVALYKWLLTNYAKPGDSILDTHLGSQSSRIAAYDLGFDFTGYELDPDYFKAGCERFERHCQQPKLFEPEPIIMKQEAMFA